MDPLVDKLVQTIASAGERTPRQQGGGTSGRTYKIGEFGPAGGIVFYDKGIFSNGWRYLEAAPVETEVNAEWGAFGQNVAGTQEGVGFGKRNTELILEHLGRLRETGRAAQVCAALDFDRFNDWFLPSRAELNLMISQGIVRPNTNYWSSSQFNYNNAWANGSQNYSKNNNYAVRAIRAF